jgi:hypothetical protein
VNPISLGTQLKISSIPIHSPCPTSMSYLNISFVRSKEETLMGLVIWALIKQVETVGSHEVGRNDFNNATWNYTA